MQMTMVKKYAEKGSEEARIASSEWRPTWDMLTNASRFSARGPVGRFGRLEWHSWRFSEIAQVVLVQRSKRTADCDWIILAREDLANICLFSADVACARMISFRDDSWLVWSAPRSFSNPQSSVTSAVWGAVFSEADPEGYIDLISSDVQSSILRHDLALRHTDKMPNLTFDLKTQGSAKNYEIVCSL